MNARKRFLAAIALPMLLSAGPARAQIQTGSILVKSVDEKGGLMPGVNVTISSPVLVAGKLNGVTDAGGAYRFPSLFPGEYSVRFEISGFQTVVREKVIVNVGLTTPIEVSMKIAGLTDEVTVSGESPVVDTTTANVSVTLDQALLQKTPGGRDIWSLVEYKVPGLVTTRPDVGGAAGGLQGGMVAKGTPNSQNTQFVNGINVGDPAAIGFTGFYYDFDAFDQIQVSTGAQDVSVPSPGVFINMVTKTGGDSWKGKVGYFWQGKATQAKNIGSELQTDGFRPDAGATKFVSDANAYVGGPLIKNKLRLLASVRDWRVHVNVAGFPEVEPTDMTSGLANLTWQMNPKNRFSLYGARQVYDKPNRGASPLFTPQSTFHEDDHFTLLQGQWNAILSQQAFLDARVSHLDIFFPLYQKGTQQSLLDQSTGILERAAQTESVFTRKRYQASVNLQYYVASALGGRHELRAGLDYQHSPTTTAQHRIDDLNLFYRSAPTATVPAGGTQVTFFNSPVDSKATVNIASLYAQDSYSRDRFTLSFGVRAETVEGFLPAQSSQPSRWFPDATRSFAAIHDIPKWKTITPRLTMAFDLTGDGKTALKLAAGRYAYTVGTGTPNSVNPNFASSATYAWNDLNKDLIYQDGERGALQSTAGSLITSFDPDIRRPYTDEFSVGFERELIPNLRVSVVGTIRRERDNFGNHNVGVPFSAYTEVVRPDIGRDGLAGTADDTTITVYNQDPSTVGKNRFVISNDPLFNSNYKGVEATLTKRFSNKWQMLASYSGGQAIADATNVTTPNNLINAKGPIPEDRKHNFKLTGQYVFPHEFYLSANLLVTSGRPITRTLSVTGLNQGTITINAEPNGSVRLDTRTQIDARLAKTLHLNAGRELELSVDGYNLTNSAYVWDVRVLTGRFNAPLAGTGPTTNLQQFLLPAQVLNPRIFRLGMNFRF